MMAYTEVGVSIARRTKRLTDENTADAEKIRAMSRIFAHDVSLLIQKNSLNILLGTGEIAPDRISAITDSPSYKELANSAKNVIKDMDIVADILFERRT